MGKNCGLPYDLYMWGGDFALIWYNPDVSGPSNVAPVAGQGKFVFLDGGKRYRNGELPKGEPSYFSMDDGAIVSLASVPASDSEPVATRVPGVRAAAPDPGGAGASTPARIDSRVNWDSSGDDGGLAVIAGARRVDDG